MDKKMDFKESTVQAQLSSSGDYIHMTETKNSQHHEKTPMITNFLSLRGLEREGLSYFLAALALMSTMIGGGIAGLPFSYFHTGLSLGLIIHLLMMILTNLSCYLYLRTKDLLHGLCSISEIGFKLIGRSSIFFINIVIVLLCVGLMIIYFDLFGNICAGLY